jgi:hypothetical protein
MNVCRFDDLGHSSSEAVSVLRGSLLTPRTPVDPLLFSLQFGSPFQEPPLAIFDLTRNLPSISIRDQIVRAALLGRALPVWLRETDKGNGQKLPILVVGGGASGITVAVELARQGFAVEVVDRAPGPFSLQRPCTTRWLDGVQYDWPLDHWTAGIFPWHPSQRNNRNVIPLACPALRASGLVRQRWDLDWADHLAKPYSANITYHWGRSLHSPPQLDAQGNLVAHLADHPNLQTVSTWGTYRAIVFAFGFGTERCHVDNSPTFVGYAFWQEDPFEFPFCSLPDKKQQSTVLISGTGDGGLQDFLRVMTRQPSARRIYEDLELQRAGVNLMRIASADHRLERATAWEARNPYPFRRAAHLQERHDTCEREVRRLLTAQLKRQVLRYVSERPERTILVSRLPYFDCLYVLNQFLALLIIEALRLYESDVVRESIEVFAPFSVSALRSSDPFGPPNPPTAQRCLGHPWEVTLEDTFDPTNTHTIPANVVVIRHGIRSAGALHPGLASFASYPRPMPPTHLLG